MIVKKYGKNSVKIAIIGVWATCVSVYAGPMKSLVDIQHWQTKNGAEVYFVELHQLPIVDVKVGFAAGSSYDGAQLGIASLTSSMLDEGTDRYNSDQIAEQFDNMGSLLSREVGRDFSWLSFRSVSDQKYLQPTTTVFANLLAHSNFPKNEYERVQKQTLMGLQYQEQLPNQVAEKALYRSIYDNQPYGHPTIGEVNTVKSLKPADLQKFYQQYYVAKNAVVVLTGDLSRNGAELLAEQITKELEPGNRAEPLTDSAATVKARQEKIDFPSTQTHVLIGQLGIEKGSSEYFPAFVGNYVLGGGVFNSRLMKTIREDKGYAYHVASNFVTMKEKGPFIIQLQTRTKEAFNATDLALKTLNEFVDKGPTNQELNLAKRSITQSFPLNLMSNSAIAANVAVISAYQLPINYLDTYQQNINAVTRKDIKETFSKLIKRDQLVTITVGKVNG